MRAYWVHVEHDFDKPRERVFAYLADPENLATVFGTRVVQLEDGQDGQPHGVGSRRRVRFGPLPPFEETVAEFVPPERIAYRITRGGVLRGYVATMMFIPNGGGTRFMYDIRVASPIPGIGPIVRAMLTRTIVSSLQSVEVAA